MRLGLIPENKLEELALKNNHVPFPIIEDAIPLLEIRAVMAGESLEIFKVLSKGPLKLKAIAKKIRCHEKGLFILLQALSGFSYLDYSSLSLKYSLSKKAKKWVDPQSKFYVGNYLRFNYFRWKMIDHLEQVIRTGKSVGLHQALQKKSDWELYIKGLLDFANVTAHEIFQKIKFKNPKAIMDIAGGHGRYSIYLCEKYSSIKKATLIDLPQSVAVAKKLVRKYGFQKCFNFVSGNLLKTEFEKGQDVILIFNILHHFDEVNNQKIIARAAAALNPGGKLLVWEPLIQEEGQKPSI
jgi:2-polyprenyl-3-methyl-5-hydroxy-6-metoxy-1,4-benzoquinol methylase